MDTISNTLFPGRPSYTGPTTGMFALLHHEKLCETSHDVMERVAYVKNNKPAREVAIRLHNMLYLGGCPAAEKRTALDADYEAKLAPLYADYEAKRTARYADYTAKLAALYAEAKLAPLYADYEAKRTARYADYTAKRTALDADYEAKLAPLYADYEAKFAPLYAEILAYVKTHIPDCAWNGSTLVFE